MKYTLKIGIALTQGMNAVIGGWPDESISSRSYRQRHKAFWGKMYVVINYIFFWQKDHCKKAYNAEVERRHSPPETRN